MAQDPAPPRCVNPACDCAPCGCPRPCTCGLEPVRRSCHEEWDPARREYRYVEIQTFAPVEGGPMPAATPAGAAGGHGHEPGTGQRATGGDRATADLAGAIAGFDPAGSALDEVRRRAGPAEAMRHDHESVSVRSADHNGHRIEIVTTYELRIDGEALTGHMGVNADGTVHYHGIPNYSTESAVDLAKQIVDSFPDDYARTDRPERVVANGDEPAGVERGAH